MRLGKIQPISTSKDCMYEYKIIGYSYNRPLCNYQIRDKGTISAEFCEISNFFVFVVVDYLIIF